MKKLTLFLFGGLLSLSTQAQELPKPSPLCKVTQMVGLTQVELEYSRPSVKGRVVFGDLVAYDKIWRLGANGCTKITTSNELKFGDQKLAAGTYALFAIPGKEEWKLVVNTDTEQWGAGNYDEEKNVLTVTAKPMENSYNETLVIEINNIGANGGNLSIQWEKIRVDFPFTVNTDEIAEANIKAAIEKGEDLDKVYYNAASYYFNSVGDNKKAMRLINSSLDVKKSHNAMFMKARITHANGDKDEAIKLAEEALSLAKEAEANGWIPYITDTISSWKAEK